MSGGGGHRRKHKGGHAEEHVNHERWLLTYADLITLLMVLFIVLFAIGQVNQKKFDQLRTGMSTALGQTTSVVSGSTGVLPGAQVTTMSPQVAPANLAPAAGKPPITVNALQDRKRLERARKLLEAALRARGLSGAVRFDLQARGLVVTIVTDNVLFASGSADLEPRGDEVLRAIGPVLRGLPNEVTVEGHTDDVPVSGRYASNWELSVSRATSVLEYLLAADRVPAARLSATGYADQRPLVPNDSDAHRSRNRRVEVVVVAQPVTATVAAGRLPVTPSVVQPPTLAARPRSLAPAPPTTTQNGG